MSNHDTIDHYDDINQCQSPAAGARNTGGGLRDDGPRTRRAQGVANAQDHPIMSDNLAKDARRACGVTQATFAAGVGVTRVTVTRWESGASAPDGPAAVLLSLIRDEATTRAKLFPRAEREAPAPSGQPGRLGINPGKARLRDED